MCGLKHVKINFLAYEKEVTPFVGVWIETRVVLKEPITGFVTPFVGVWIETREMQSLSLQNKVTPFVGVWIETFW